MFDSKGNQISNCLYVPYLGAECRDILLRMQVITDRVFYYFYHFFFTSLNLLVGCLISHYTNLKHW